MEWVASTLHTTSEHGVYPALLPLMRTPRLPVVDWTDAPAGLNGLVRFAERRNLVSLRAPSHFKHNLLIVVYMRLYTCVRYTVCIQHLIPIVVYVRCTAWWWAIDRPETCRVCLTEYTEDKLYIKLVFLYTNILRRSTVNKTYNSQAPLRFSSAIHTYSSHRESTITLQFHQLFKPRFWKSPFLKDVINTACRCNSDRTMDTCLTL